MMVTTRYGHFTKLCIAFGMVLCMLIMFTIDDIPYKIFQNKQQQQEHRSISEVDATQPHLRDSYCGNVTLQQKLQFASIAKNTTLIDFDLEQPAKSHYRPESCRDRLFEYLCRHADGDDAVKERSIWSSRMSTVHPPADTCSSTSTRVAILALLSDASFKGNNSLHTFESMVRILNDDRFRFFVHIDQRASQAFRHHVQLLISKHSPRLVPTKKTFPVYWGGVNMILATIASLVQAWRDFCPDFVVNVSETHMPLMHADRMISWLDQHSQANYLHQLRPTSQSEWESKRDYLYLSDCLEALKPVRVHASGSLPFGNKGNSQLHDSSSILTSLNSSVRLLEVQNVSGIPDLIPWKGSQWFVLSKNFVHWFLTSDLPKQILPFFEWWEVPDEKYFATCLALSPFKSTINALHPAHFVANRKNGRIATMSDIKSAMFKKSLFVRKVTNSTLIKMVEGFVTKDSLPAK